jgi:hypothetical protein
MEIALPQRDMDSDLSEALFKLVRVSLLATGQNDTGAECSQAQAQPRRNLLRSQPSDHSMTM